MQSALKTYWNRMNGINGFILMAYLLFVCVADALTSASYSYRYLFTSFVCTFLLCLVLCPVVMQFLSKLQVRNLSQEQEKCRFCSTILQAAFYLIPFAVFFLYYLAFYPGGFSSDSIDQYTQAVTGQYNDWHPVFQTLFAFTLPLALTGGWGGSVALFQIICLSGVLGYTFQVIYKYTNIKFTLISMVFVLMNPYLTSVAITPWKDVSFAIGALLLLTYSLEICFTRGLWIKKPVHTVLYILVAVATTLFRHNALLFTVPLIFAVLFYITPKKSLLICLSVLVLCLGIKGPVYTAMDVQSPDKRQVETLGLPMTVIGGAVKFAPDSLDEETLEFAYKIAPKDVWEEKYVYGSYNHVKWDNRTDNLVIEEYGAPKVLSMMVKSFASSTRFASTALVYLTRSVYALRGGFSVNIQSIASNPFGLVQRSGGYLSQFFQSAFETVKTYLSYPLFHMGFWHLVLIAAILAKCSLNKFRDWKKIFFMLPVFAYNYGTSLLLTGAEDAIRFFFYMFPLIPVYLVFLFKDATVQDKEIDS